MLNLSELSTYRTFYALHIEHVFVLSDFTQGVNTVLLFLRQFLGKSVFLLSSISEFSLDLLQSSHKPFAGTEFFDLKHVFEVTLLQVPEHRSRNLLLLHQVNWVFLRILFFLFLGPLLLTLFRVLFIAIFLFRLFNCSETSLTSFGIDVVGLL